MNKAPPPAQVRPGSVAEALANGRRLLKDHPRTALDQAHAILRGDPSDPDALRLAAAAHRALGEPADAERAELAAIHHSKTIPLLAQAAAALDAKQPAEGSRLAAERLKQRPDDLAALTLSAESALAMSLPDKAEPLLRRVLSRLPSFVPARMLLVTSLQLQDKLREALAVLEPVLTARPHDPTALRQRAKIETDLGDHQAAAVTYESLLKAAGDAPDVWITYGDALRFLGRKTDSALAYRRALAIDRRDGQAWWSLVNLDPASTDAEAIEAMETALADRTDEPEHAGNLHFALGGAYDALGRYADAFPHFAAGNALRLAAQPYDPEEIKGQVGRYVEAFRSGSVPERSSMGRRGPAPIFIVGMPRSGSTLVERILGRHPQIEALGELPIMPHIVEAMRRDDPTGPLERRIAALSRNRLDEIAARYLDRSAEHRRSDRPWFTDKLHMNWRHLPLILRALPGARVIDVRRSALDCCWSNYKLLFARGHPAASDLGHLGRFFRDYVRLIDHLEGITPDAILQIRYEDVVDDVDAQTRRMLAFLDLEYDPSCVDFHLSKDPVATASSEQVRRPLNRSGIGSWRNYAPWLEPLREALGPYAVEEPVPPA